MRLLEDSELHKGIFWIVNQDNIESNRDYCFIINCDSEGNTLSSEHELNAKSGNTYNHERFWNSLPSYYTKSKPYNYFPRGRVEINNGKAIIYLNPNINNEEVISFITNKFNLNEHNGIKKIRAVSDGSDHYKCYLDN